jgi:hypothetical protein
MPTTNGNPSAGVPLAGIPAGASLQGCRCRLRERAVPLNRFPLAALRDLARRALCNVDCEVHGRNQEASRLARAQERASPYGVSATRPPVDSGIGFSARSRRRARIRRRASEVFPESGPTLAREQYLRGPTQPRGHPAERQSFSHERTPTAGSRSARTQRVDSAR